MKAPDQQTPMREPMFYRGTRIIFDYEMKPIAVAIRAVFHRPDWLAEWRRQSFIHALNALS